MLPLSGRKSTYHTVQICEASSKGGQRVVQVRVLQGPAQSNLSDLPSDHTPDIPNDHRSAAPVDNKPNAPGVPVK
jgi:hypothetical protein